MEERIRVALIGNPNSGKTSLFNVLTGSRQHVGNWPGVTIEKKTGTRTHCGRTPQITDLPGTYSLAARSPDEAVANDFIAAGSAFVVASLIEVLSASSAVEWIGVLTTGNLMLGLVLVLAVSVFLAGAHEAMRGRGGEAYMVVGSLIGLFAGTVALLTMGANGAEHLLGNEELAGWTALDDFTLAIVMILPSTLLIRQELRAFRSDPEAEVAT